MDWIDAFMDATKGLRSPEPFRLWSAITGISGVLERRVYTEGSGGPIFPGLFTILVGVPGSGKTQAIRKIRDIWTRIKDLKVSPDSVTKASLIEVLARSLRSTMSKEGEISIYSSLCVQCSEFGVFFVNYDTEFISVLNHIYDDPPFYEEERIVAGIRKVDQPHLVILSGTQPDYIDSFMPDQAWGMGFASRLIMISADAPAPMSLRGNIGQKSQDIIQLSNRLIPLMEQVGEFRWSDAAWDELDKWTMADCPPKPNHPKLFHYAARRDLTAMKLSMISGASRTGTLLVGAEDVQRSIHWLVQAEQRMPDIFANMSHRSDDDLLNELHMKVLTRWSNGGHSVHPVPTSELYFYLKDKVHVERIPRLIDAASKSGLIRPGYHPDEWLPKEAP